MVNITSNDSMLAQKNIRVFAGKISNSVSSLASGDRSDVGVADLSVGTVLSSTAEVLRVTLQNAGQAIRLLETAKGAAEQIVDLTLQQQSLAVKSSDASLSDNERAFLNTEFSALTTEIDRIASNTNFNGVKLLDGSISGSSGLTTATGLATENYSIISNSAFGTAGTAESTGGLVTTAGERAENIITISSGTEDAATTLSLVISRGTHANADSKTISISTAVGDTNTDLATKLIAAANAATGDLASAFEFEDLGSGRVRVVASEVGTQFNDYTFLMSDGGDAGGTFEFDWGGAGTRVEMEGTERVLTNNDASTIVPQDTAITTVGAQSFGEVAAQANLTFANTGGTTDGDLTFKLLDVDGSSSTITIRKSATYGSTTALASQLAELASESTNAIFRKFTFEAQSSNVVVTAVDKGEAANYVQFGISSVGSASGFVSTSLTFGGDRIGTSAVSETISTIATANNRTLGSNRDVNPNEETYDTNLIGGLTNFAATFNATSTPAGSYVTGERNSLTFSVEVNGTTYISDPVQLFSIDGNSGMEAAGDRIKANQRIYFYNPDAAKDDSGNITDNGFSLQVGTTDIELAAFTTAAGGQEAADTIANNFETQLGNVVFTQERSAALTQVDASASNHKIKGTIGTLLDGLVGFDSTGTDVTAYNKGDVKFINDGFGDTGTLGNIGTFSVSRATDTISVDIGDVTYTAYLNDTTKPTTGGVTAFGFDNTGLANDGAYNATTKILDLADADNTTFSTPKFIFYSESTTDGNRLEIDLGNVVTNVGQINIATDDGETALENALNAIFGTADNESLTFQVGSNSSNTIGVSLNGLETEDIYLDSSNVSKTLSIDTAANAAEANDILQTARNKVIETLSDISAAITAFDSAITTNEVSLENAQAASDSLLKTDYSKESTKFAEATVGADAALAVLAQANARIQNLLQLFQ